MAKVVDITDKLDFDGNPKLVIKGEELEVNGDAPTLLKVMGLLKKDPDVTEVLDALNLILPDESRKKIEAMKLSFQDLMVVVQEAIALITGDVEMGER